MGAKKPPPHEAVTIISGDWSTGFNAASSSSLSDAKLLAHIGSRLREYYKHLADERASSRLLIDSIADEAGMLEARTLAGTTEAARFHPDHHRHSQHVGSTSGSVQKKLSRAEANSRLHGKALSRLARADEVIE